MCSLLYLLINDFKLCLWVFSQQDGFRLNSTYTPTSFPTLPALISHLQTKGFLRQMWQRDGEPGSATRNPVQNFRFVLLFHFRLCLTHDNANVFCVSKNLTANVPIMLLTSYSFNQTKTQVYLLVPPRM